MNPIDREIKLYHLMERFMRVFSVLVLIGTVYIGYRVVSEWGNIEKRTDQWASNPVEIVRGK